MTHCWGDIDRDGRICLGVMTVRSCEEGCCHDDTLPRPKHNKAGTPESNFAYQVAMGGKRFILLRRSGCILTGNSGRNSNNIFSKPVSAVTRKRCATSKLQRQRKVQSKKSVIRGAYVTVFISFPIHCVNM